MAKKSGEIPAAQPVIFKDLVQYSEGAVVSRTIAKSKQGTLTVFAFDEGEELSEHTVPFDAYVQILAGQAELVIDGKSVIANAGETILMPANFPHAVIAKQRFKMFLIMIREKVVSVTD